MATNKKAEARELFRLQTEVINLRARIQLARLQNVLVNLRTDVEDETKVENVYTLTRLLVKASQGNPEGNDDVDGKLNVQDGPVQDQEDHEEDDSNVSHCK